MSAPPADDQGTASHPKRDRNLLVPDDVLTDNDFDNLWDWFASAVETNVDRQLIFATLVNSVGTPFARRAPSPLLDYITLTHYESFSVPVQCYFILCDSFRVPYAAGFCAYVRVLDMFGNEIWMFLYPITGAKSISQPMPSQSYYEPIPVSN
ncbi:hypothetical protein BDZ91DRAFT_509135 [Kalaharituber pfeilii]|nr:hypothetical protein BDZ91DRAFT_509135 [Kalaharituber pfeilii]